MILGSFLDATAIFVAFRSPTSSGHTFSATQCSPLMFYGLPAWGTLGHFFKLGRTVFVHNSSRNAFEQG